MRSCFGFRARWGLELRDFAFRVLVNPKAMDPKLPNRPSVTWMRIAR